MMFRERMEAAFSGRAAVTCFQPVKSRPVSTMSLAAPLVSVTVAVRALPEPSP